MFNVMTFATVHMPVLTFIYLQKLNKRYLKLLLFHKTLFSHEFRVCAGEC